MTANNSKIIWRPTNLLGCLRITMFLAVGIFGVAAPAMGQRKTIFDDDFEAYTNLYTFGDLIAAGYEVVNGSGFAVAAWRLWNTDGDLLGAEDPNIAGMTDNYVISDSDLWAEADMNEELITPNIDCTEYSNVRLDFNKNVRIYPDDPDHDQICEVDIRSSHNGVTWSGWVNLLHWDRTTVAEYDTDPEQVDISAHANGKMIQIRFHFYDAEYDWWFAIDNIEVSGEPAVDIGLRVYDGTEIVAIACEPQGTLTSPLRIAKNGVVYGIALVEPSDPAASKIRIQASSGIKALRKF